MAANVLSLPVDIPWKRLCVSEDMIDRKVGDRRFPYRWRSSVAVFSYQPPEDQQAYEGMIVSYLKVACTITSFQPNPEEVGIKDRRVDSYWNDPAVITDYAGKVNAAYGCYGAILEVGVAPSKHTNEDDEVSLSKYPYFIDFEPKKREVYETVSQSGEQMSRSLDEINVSKGTTTTDAHEVLDETKVGVAASGGFFGIGVSGSYENSSGTKDLNQQEVSNVRTTDSAREQRENFSHTTQLTQMYHQLNSYHLGTNRAVFFIVPRPHIKESPLTFVNGPRQLEGVQEFFLVVMRPKEIQDICVEAYLETAHLGNVPVYEDRFNYDTDTTQLLSLYKEATKANSGSKVSGSISYSVRQGWEIDISNSGGYQINIIQQTGVLSCGVTEIDQTHLVLAGEVQTFFETIKVFDPESKEWVAENNSVDGRLEANATVFLRQKRERVQTGFVPALYITGRGVDCCVALEDDGERELFMHARNLLKESVVWEQALPLGINEPVGGNGRIKVADANRIGTEISRMIVQSINHPNRYESGSISFAETQFIARSVANVISSQGHPDDHSLENIAGLNPEIKRKITTRLPGVLRSDLLFMSPAEQTDRFDLSLDEVRHLRRAILGLEGSLPEPQHRWDPPSQTRTKQTVPNVVGLTLTEANAALQAVQLFVGEMTYQDSEQPHDVVLAQEPSADTTVLSSTMVNLIAATGATVRIPDVVGKLLSQALIMLRDAGLKSEPEICFTSSEEYPRNQVIEVSPRMRSYITPHACVTLQISSGASKCETSNQGTV